MESDFIPGWGPLPNRTQRGNESAQQPSNSILDAYILGQGRLEFSRHPKQGSLNLARLPKLTTGSHLVIPSTGSQENNIPCFRQNISELSYLLFTGWFKLGSTMGIKRYKIDLARNALNKTNEPPCILKAAKQKINKYNKSKQKKKIIHIF